DASGNVFVTYTLSNVVVSSFATNEAGGLAPVDTLTLQFTKVAEDYSPHQPNGTLGAPNRANFDLQQDLGSSGSLSAPALAVPPTVGLAFDDGSGSGTLTPELAVASYAWSGSKSVSTSGTFSLPNLDDFSLVLAPTSAEPGIWGHLATGKHLTTAVVHV